MFENNINNDNLNFKQNFDTTFSNSNKKSTDGFKLGPLTVGKDRLDLFGFSLAFDDIILIALILILMLDPDSDFTLLIILGLILFNISFSNLKLFN